MFQRYNVFFASLAITLLIVTGFSFVLYSDHEYYHNLALKQVESTVSMAAADVSKNIGSYVAEQITIAEGMATDSFLWDWLATEPDAYDKDEVQPLLRYLGAYQKKYKYNLVFLISDKSLRYYYQDGLIKTISPDEPIDVWYYNFLRLGYAHDIQLDRSEIDNYASSIFVNCRVVNDAGEFLGVIGSGRKINSTQERINRSCEELGLNIYVVNTGNAANSLHWTMDYFKTPEEVARLTGLSPEEISTPHPRTDPIWLGTRCLKIEHDANLHWNFIIEKDTVPLMEAYAERLRYDIICILLIIVGCVTISTGLIRKLNNRVKIVENMDAVTNLPNSKLFQERFLIELGKYGAKPMTLVMFDIDNFKACNDTLGHLYGNTVLKLTADYIQKNIGKNGFFSRWGGDEFIGLFFQPPQETQKWMDELNRHIREQNANIIPISLSIGLTLVDPAIEFADLLDQADAALYQAKENGKNQSVIYTLDPA